MASISDLPEDAIMPILQFLDTSDRIAFAFTCQTFKRICTQQTTVMRKVDLSRHPLRTKQGTIKEFFQDKEMVQNIKELNLSNYHAFNWKMDVHLQQFIITCCPQLEALHVLNCKMSLKTLHGILQHAPKLTALSFSIMNLSGEDAEFIRTKFVNNMCLQNIKNLHVEIPFSTTHFQLLKYLLLPLCKFLEELEIFIWESSFIPFECEVKSSSIIFLREMTPPVTGPLQYFHSLKMISVMDSYYYDSVAFNLISDFVASIAAKKSRETKWKKLWISPPIDINILQKNGNLDEFDSLEELSLDNLVNAEQKVKTLFQEINNNVVRKLWMDDVKFFNQFSESVARIGGDALQCLKVSHDLRFRGEDLEAKIAFDTVFSACPNITELSLESCHFNENICENLSKLKHLAKIQVSQCAIVPERDEAAQQIANSSLLSLVESCRNVTEFHLYDCRYCLCQQHLTEDDLMPIAKWTKLESFVCVGITFANQDDDQEAAEMEPPEHDNTLLEEIIENCKFLTALKISTEEYASVSDFSFLESAVFLKHLAITIPEANLGSEGFWQLLNCAINLERLCITSEYIGSIHVDGAVEMVKSLPQLQVLHLHLGMAQNIKLLMDKTDEMLEEEDSGRKSSFEFFLTEDEVLPTNQWSLNKGALLMNRWELCSVIPSFDMPRI